MSVNKVILVGNLANDPDKRYTPAGSAVTTFRVVTNERYTDKSGEKKDKTEGHNIVVWNKLAEICAEYLYKGKQVYIEGKISTRQYEKNGIRHYFTEIIASQMQMLGRKDDNQQGGGDGYAGGQNQNQGGQNYNQGGQNQNTQQSNAGQQQGGGFEEPVFNPDDEIPF